MTQDNYPKKSWILENPIYDCPFGQGKCRLSHEESKTISCIYEKKEYCPYRKVEDKK
jgi:hypothetical protein